MNWDAVVGVPFNIIATGTKNGNPAPLKDSVGYVLDTPLGTGTPLPTDPNSIQFMPTGVGACVVTGTSGALPPVSITVNIAAAPPEFADTLVLTPQTI